MGNQQNFSKHKIHSWLNEAIFQLEEEDHFLEESTINNDQQIRRLLQALKEEKESK